MTDDASWDIYQVQEVYSTSNYITSSNIGTIRALFCGAAVVEQELCNIECLYSEINITNFGRIFAYIEGRKTVNDH